MTQPPTDAADPPQPEGPSLDPEKVATELAEKLSARSRHVVVFLGAGAACASGLPDLAGLHKRILETLDPLDRDLTNEVFGDRSLEDGLSRLRRIASLLQGTETFASLSRERALELDQRLCAAIVTAVDLTGTEPEPFVRLATWIARSDYKQPVEVFTVNYDLLVETGLERLGVPFFDGFVGSLDGSFRADLIEPTDSIPPIPSYFARVWKLHGSVNWAFTERSGRREVVRKGAAVSGPAAAIYPSEEKYDDSRRVPFVALMDRFRRSLAEPETILIVSGYSFRDQHLNEVVFDAALRHPRSEIFVTCHSEIPGDLAVQALKTPSLTVVARSDVIIGGRRHVWSRGSDLPEVYESKRFLLGDFKALTDFLSRSSVSTNES
jgi:hypothetical protein